MEILYIIKILVVSRKIICVNESIDMVEISVLKKFNCDIVMWSHVIWVQK